MQLAVFLLALAMVAMGAAAVVFGAPILGIERGNTMVIAGSVTATGGAALLGLTAALIRLRRIERELVKARERATRAEIPPVEPARRPGAERPAEPAADPVPLRPTLAPAEPARPAEPGRPAEPARPAEPPPRSVIGRYASGGNSYVMYSDGSIDAETPAGPRRFASMAELKAYAAAGR